MDRFNNIDISGAAAQIARQNLADSLLAGIGLLRQQRVRGSQEPGCAETALECMVLAE